MLLYSRNQFMKYLLKYSFTARRVARIWKRGGGAILKEWELCKRPWLEFSLNLNQFQTVCPKIKTKFLGKLGNSKVFSAENQVFSKKKKGLHWNWEWFFGRSPKFKGFYRPKSGVLQKNKKGLHWNWEWFFGRKSEIQRFFPLKIRCSPKKKKVFTEIESDFSAEIRNSKVFSAQNQVFSKKKRSSPKLRLIFRPI